MNGRWVCTLLTSTLCTSNISILWDTISYRKEKRLENQIFTFSDYVRDSDNSFITTAQDGTSAHVVTFLPLNKSPVGQADAVLPEDVGHRQRNAHMSGNITQTLVKLLKLLKEDIERANKIKSINKNKGDFFMLYLEETVWDLWHVS